MLSFDKITVHLDKSYKTDTTTSSSENDDRIEDDEKMVDEKYFDRLEIQHRLFKIIWNGNFSVPLQQQLCVGNTRVLEVGYV